MSSEKIIGKTSGPLSFIKYFSGTDIGKRREENQDYYGIVQNLHFSLFIVADGMGGVQGGAIASKLAVETVKTLLSNKRVLDSDAIVSSVNVANSLIHERGNNESELNGMGTTFVALGFQNTELFIVNVGDSRAYRYRLGHLECLTEDHTLVMELVRSGTITLEQAGNHPVSHMLTRSMGPAADVGVDCRISEDGPYTGDKYLMCSDGLYNLVSDEEIATILERYSKEEAVPLLINMANSRGGTDNITIVIVEVEDGFPVPVPSEVVEEYSTLPKTARPAVDFAAEQAKYNIPKVDPFGVPELDEAMEQVRKKTTEMAMEYQRQKAAGYKPDPKHQNIGFVSEGEEEKLEETISESVQPDGQSATGNQYPNRVRVDYLAILNKELKKLTKFVTKYIVPISIFFGFLAGAVLVAVFGGDKPNPILTEINPKTPAKPQIEIAAADKPTEGTDKSQNIQPEFEKHITNIAVKDNLNQRKESLVNSIRNSEADLVLLDSYDPQSGKDSSELFEKNKVALESQFNLVRDEIDAATRTLATWHGRRAKLQDTDLTSLASEVAVVAPTVKSKKEEFEQVSWSYLKEAEALRNNPNDAKQKSKVEALVAERNKRMQEMSNLVFETTRDAIKESEAKITDLTNKREKVREEIDAISHKIEFIKIIESADKEKKEVKKQEILKSLETSRAELKEIETLLEKNN